MFTIKATDVHTDAAPDRGGAPGSDSAAPRRRRRRATLSPKHASTLLALDTYDTQFPHYAPGCAHGCAAWASAASANYSQATINGYFTGPRGATAAGTDCDAGRADRQPRVRLRREGRRPVHGRPYAGPWCFCAGSDAKPDGTTAYCTPARSHAEQINVQLADATTVVVSFVTYDVPSDPPIAMLGLWRRR